MYGKHTLHAHIPPPSSQIKGIDSQSPVRISTPREGFCFDHMIICIERSNSTPEDTLSQSLILSCNIHGRDGAKSPLYGGLFIEN